MNAAQLVALIHHHNLRIFTTADMVTLTGLKKDATVQALRRLQGNGILWHVKRGVWVLRLAKDILPQELLPYLTAPWPSYVSLESALSEWGIVSQVPSIIHAVTLGKPLHFNTPLGSFQIHHLQKKLFGGCIHQRAGNRGYWIATPEKAILDTLYFRYRLGGKPNVREWDLSKVRHDFRYSPNESEILPLVTKLRKFWYQYIPRSRTVYKSGWKGIS